MTAMTQGQQMETTESITRPLSVEQLGSLQKFAGTIGRFGAGFYAFDACADCLLDVSAPNCGGDISQIAEYAERTLRLDSDDIQRFGQGDEILGVCLKGFGETVAVAVVDTRPYSRSDGVDVPGSIAPGKTATVLLRDPAA